MRVHLILYLILRGGEKERLHFPVEFRAQLAFTDYFRHIFTGKVLIIDTYLYLST